MGGKPPAKELLEGSVGGGIAEHQLIPALAIDERVAEELLDGTVEAGDLLEAAVRVAGRSERRPVEVHDPEGAIVVSFDEDVAEVEIRMNQPPVVSHAHQTQGPRKERPGA